MNTVLPSSLAIVLGLCLAGPGSADPAVIGNVDGRKTYRIYGDDPSYHPEDGTDFAAIAADLIAVTPLHFDLTATDALEELGGFDLDRLIRPAAQEVE